MDNQFRGRLYTLDRKPPTKAINVLLQYTWGTRVHLILSSRTESTSELYFKGANTPKGPTNPYFELLFLNSMIMRDGCVFSSLLCIRAF